jgi:integrase
MGGGYMKGYVRWHEPAKRHYVGVYWQGKEERFWRYMGMPLYDKRTAVKLLSQIQADIDKRTFDPRYYRQNSPLTLGEYSRVWLSTADICKNTKKLYSNAINKAIEYFGKDHDIRDFTHSQLDMFKKSLPLSNDAVYNIMGALKTMLKYYQKDFHTFAIPTFPKMSKQAKETTEYLTYEEQEKVLNAIPERHRPIYIIMMEYGIRPQEATALKWDCVTDTHITFKRSHSEYELRETTKTGDQGIRVETITSRANVALVLAKKSLSFQGWVFGHNKRGSHYDNKLLNKLWKLACQSTGITIGLYEAVRHSLGCQLADSGYSLDFIQDVYKHTSIKTTRRYAKRQRSQIADALENRGKVIPFKKTSLDSE